MKNGIHVIHNVDIDRTILISQEVIWKIYLYKIKKDLSVQSSRCTEDFKYVERIAVILLGKPNDNANHYNIISVA